MHSLTFTTAIAAVLTDAAVCTAAILAQGAVDPSATPQLGVIVTDFSSPHPSMHRGNLVLRYHFDLDATTELAASEDITRAVDYLLAPENRSALQDALAPSSIWLRLFGPAAMAPAETGERSRSIDHVIPFWFQTSV